MLPHNNIRFVIVVAVIAAILGGAVFFALRVFRNRASAPNSQNPSAVQSRVSRFIIDERASGVALPDSVEVYAIDGELTQERISQIAAFWNLSPQPHKILPPNIYYWNKGEQTLAIDVGNRILHYRNNNAPAPPQRNQVFSSLDEASRYGATYLQSSPFLNANPVFISASFLKKEGLGEPLEVNSLQEAQFLLLSYGELVNDIPVVSKEFPDGKLYSLTLDQRGRVLGFSAKIIERNPQPTRTVSLKNVEEIKTAVAQGNVSYITIDDEAAAIDQNALFETATVTRIGIAYLLDDAQHITLPVYLISGTSSYQGHEVRITALYLNAIVTQ